LVFKGRGQPNTVKSDISLLTREKVAGSELKMGAFRKAFSKPLVLHL